MRVGRRIRLLLRAPGSVPEFFARTTGREYGVGTWRKLLLFLRIIRNNLRIPTGSHVFEHLVMAAKIMQVPKSLPGCIVECGSWKGGSAANLSLVADLCGRQLHVFDSFAGLPTPDRSEIMDYRAGDFCGTFSEVEANIRRCGRIDRCTFHRGFFAETLPGFSEPCVLAFVDVDLISSLNDCLKTLWPLIQPGCYLFSHEARDPRIIQVFRDRSQVLIGAGHGLPLIPGPDGLSSDLGYTVKDTRRRE